MIFRPAVHSDIPQIQRVRLAVQENILSDPSRVANEDCLDYITNRGKGWVCVLDQRIIGFAIVDLQENNVWALFVDPDHGGMGIGETLHFLMVTWYFEQMKTRLGLSTEPRTRAEIFYKKQGWTKTGIDLDGDVSFEMTLEDWVQRNPG
jgi:GNAT superfamily N-acetyltransferase